MGEQSERKPNDENCIERERSRIEGEREVEQREREVEIEGTFFLLINHKSYNCITHHIMLD